MSAADEMDRAESGSRMEIGTRGLRMVVLGEERLTDLDIPSQCEVIIGRDSKASICLEHDGISQTHAMLRVGASISITDLHSNGGTFIGGRRLEPQTAARVLPGEVIGLGPLKVVLYRDAHTTETDLPPTAAQRTSTAVSSSMVLLDPAMIELYDVAASVASGDISVLIIGETGTGKELLAEAVHRNSSRRHNPLLRLNCAALSEPLLESELFGHEKGAFTGATQTKPGLLETVAGGTVFLDEIGEMPRGLQAKLLRVIEDRTVTRVGGLRERPIDVRFISATNRDIDVEVQMQRHEGSVRRDLYYRLSGATLRIPPLRERPAEIEPLARHFLENAARAARRVPPQLSAGALERLRAHPWHGNVRELRNVMERAALVCRHEVTPEHVPLHGANATVTRAAPSPVGAMRTLRPAELEMAVGGNLPSARPEAMEGDELSRIVDALEQCGGNQTQAARLLGMARGTLVSRLDDYGMPRPRKPIRFRPAGTKG